MGEHTLHANDNDSHYQRTRAQGRTCRENGVMGERWGVAHIEALDVRYHVYAVHLLGTIYAWVALYKG